MKNIQLLIMVSTMCVFAACKDDVTTPITDYSALLSNVSNNVILKTYIDLNTKADALAMSLATLEATKTTANLDAARTAWRTARIPWEQNEGFLFGPVDQQGIDPSIDSWPVNVADLDAVLASSNTLNKNYIDGLEGTLKGFHTLEYLLFGENGTKTVNDFTPRQFEYLRACAQSLKGSTQKLYDAWRPDGQNFIQNVVNAGKTGSIYPSQKAAVQEFVDGCIVIADEVGNGKINEPFAQQNVKLEESRFSANSKADFADNIRSIRNVYVGGMGVSSGEGLSNIIKNTDATLDTKIKNQIEAAITAIEGIPGTFTTAISQQKAAVSTAQIKVRELQATLEGELKPLLNK